MESKLSVISLNLLQKRIKREIDILIKCNICNENDIDIKQYNTGYSSNPFEYIIGIKNLLDNKYYEFKISNCYPFKPPKVYINKKPLSFHHGFDNRIYNNALKKYTGINCFCCETILCSNNWGPPLTFKDVFNDIEKYRHAIRQVINRIIIRVIKRKYLIYDINIVEWLY